MKLIQHIDGVVVEIRDAREGTTLDNLAIVEAVPTFEPREGCNGVLMYGADGLYWDYVEVPHVDEVSGEELAQMIEEVL
jgi:hypothetical protein